MMHNTTVPSLACALILCAATEPSPDASSPRPVAVTIASLKWTNTTIVSMSEGSLLSLENEPDRGHQRVSVSDPEFVERVAALYAKLVPLPPAEPPRDFRILAQLIWRDGRTVRVGIPASCQAMTRDGVPVAFNRELHELLASKLSAQHRRALGGQCAVTEPSGPELPAKPDGRL